VNTFYTNVQVKGSKILYRGVENGRRVRLKLPYHPTLFVPTNSPSEYTTVKGEYVAPIQPGTIFETKQFIEGYVNVPGVVIYGQRKFEYAYIADNFEDKIDWNSSYLNISIIDIEVGSEAGFPSIAYANEPVTAITIKSNRGKFNVFGCGEFKNSRSDVNYIKCDNERDLISRFLSFWETDYPDIITGWNVRFFDIPYLVNRITKLFSKETAERLSPWGSLWERQVFIMNRENTAYAISGVATLDYLELYKKFSGGGAKESYKLDFIANLELGERKLSYDEYKSLHKLYKLNYQLFIEYNIRDVELIEKMEKKKKLLELALTLAYNSKTNYEDVFHQVRMWTMLCYNYLRTKNQVIPPQISKPKIQYEGAYVKEAKPGVYYYVASFDLQSEYPHLIMQYNLGPDTLIDPKDYTPEMKDIFNTPVPINVDNILEDRIPGLTEKLQKANVTLTPNGQLFRLDKKSFMAEIMESMFNDRTKYRAIAQDYEKKYEEDKIEEHKILASQNDMLQSVIKICLNSCYGATGNEHFLFFDVRIAEGITMAGQLSIRWIGKYLNGFLNKAIA
jgi:DNA polymerase elongation subunit (family B)